MIISECLDPDRLSSESTGLTGIKRRIFILAFFATASAASFQCSAQCPALTSRPLVASQARDGAFILVWFTLL